MNIYEVRQIFLNDSLAEKEWLEAFAASPVMEIEGLDNVREAINGCNTHLHPCFFCGIQGFYAKSGYVTYWATKKSNKAAQIALSVLRNSSERV